MKFKPIVTSLLLTVIILAIIGCTNTTTDIASFPVITSVKSDRPRTLPGDPAPIIYWLSTDNTTHSLMDYRGKPIIINTWNVSCTECGPEFPYFQQIENKYGQKEIVFLSINTFDGSKDTKTYLDDKKCNFKVLLEMGKREVYKKFGVPKPADPYTFFIDANGILIDIKIGPFKSASEIEDLLHKHNLIK